MEQVTFLADIFSVVQLDKVKVKAVGNFVGESCLPFLFELQARRKWVLIVFFITVFFLNV